MADAPLLYQLLLQFPPELGEHRNDLSAAMLTSTAKDSGDKEFHLWVASDETSTVERLSLVEDKKFGITIFSLLFALK